MVDSHRLQNIDSKPWLSQFNPRVIPWQWRVLKDIRQNFDYADGFHELLLSGSVGSAKSILMAHLAVTHCVMYPRSRVVLCRRSMPDLKATILTKILEHIEEDMLEGEDFKRNRQQGEIYFSNGSEIVSRSWADGRFESKFRSLEVSGAVIEELTENDDDDSRFYYELASRIGRLTHVPEKWIIAATNPDGPEHWAYKYFIDSNKAKRHVYYSLTEDNPFLPRSYIDNLKDIYDAKMIRRMLYGEWVEIRQEVIYYAYDKTVSFKNTPYIINPEHPIHICFDFNIGAGKPMSACAFQRIGQTFHFFKEWIVHGADTEAMMDEIGDSGILDKSYQIYIHGDATGRARATQARHSDYDIITSYLDKYRTQTEPRRRINWQLQVPRDNPPVRKRHNIVNGLMKNAKGQTNLYVWQCETLDRGFRLVKLKKGGHYVEDDSKEFQHVTTAAGYGIIAAMRYDEPSHQSFSRWGTV